MAVGSLISFPEEMKVIKTLFFIRNVGVGKKDHARQILSRNKSVQTQGMKKRNHEIFGVSKIWR